MRRAAVIRLALAAVAGLGLNLALFQAFARLPVAVAVAAFGCYPLLVAAWEAASRRRAPGVLGMGMGMFMATTAIIGLVLLIRPDPSVSVPAAGLLLALLAAVLHAVYIMLGRGGWGEVGDGAATFLIFATAAAGLGALTAMTRPGIVLAPVTDFGLAALLLLEGALAGAVAPPAVPGRPAPCRGHPDRGAVAVRTPRRHAARCHDAPSVAGPIAAAGGRAAGRRRHRRPGSARLSRLGRPHSLVRIAVSLGSIGEQQRRG
jgi:hypothetical protein